MKAMLAHIDNRMNPIVIKELRQAVNGRFVASLLILFLMISILTFSLIAMSAAGSSNVITDGGQDFLFAMQCVLVIVCMVFLPGYAGLRLAGEWSDSNTDLMFITTIKPRAVIWGKLLATVILGMMIYAACMPFMMLSFMIRGVDLPTIVMILLIGFSSVVIGIQLGIFAATLSTALGFRLLLGLLILVALGYLAWGTLMMSHDAIDFGLFSSWDDGQMWAFLSSWLVMLISVLSLLFVFSVARISQPTANRALPVRLTMSGVWLLNTILLSVMAIIERESMVIVVYLYATSIALGLTLMIVVCERDRWGPRIRRTIPRRGLFRMIAMVYYSGALGGLLWVAMTFGLALGATVIVFDMADRSSAFIRIELDEAIVNCTRIVLFAYSYSMTALLLRRFMVGKILRPDHTWALVLVLIAIGSVLPMLVSMMMWGTSGMWNHKEAWMLPNLMLLFTDEHQLRSSSLLFYGTWAVLVTLLSGPWLVGQLHNFKPLEPNADRELQAS